MNNPKIVCLCGSTKFKDEFMYWNKFWTKLGYIVLMPGVFAHSGDSITDYQKEKLDKLHKQKIDMASIVFVINADNYIGYSTGNEINYARSLKKKVLYAYSN